MASPEDTKTLDLLFECDAAPPGQWGVERGTLRDSLNDPYVLTLELIAEDVDADPSQLLGQPAKLTLTRGETLRQVTGIVSEVREGNTDPERVTAALTIVPAFEALRHRVNTKIFQEKTVPEILEEVLSEGLGAWSRSVDNRLERTYPTCEYRTQYDESDFAFCERLMEEEGIVYWFEFEGDAETMVLADSDSKYGEIASMHGSSVSYSLSEGQVGGHEYVSSFFGHSRIRPTKIATRHFDWTHPSAPIEGESTESAETDRPDGASVEPEREVYEHDEQPLTLHEYGGQAYGANDVEDQAKLRREAHAWDAFLCEGRSTVLGMTAGSLFELTGHPQVGFNGRYLVVAVTHEIEGTGTSYENEIQAIPQGVAFRPTRETPRPRAASVQTATVVGPSGEEIHTDEHGRIKVQFHWDRLGAMDDHSSCWVRVMQPWAGAGWGFVFIPRIGMEVVVRYVDGDPDRPVVIGSVYNGDHPLPYALPDEKTKSTIKTESSLGGGGYNELRFEDKAGSEEIFTHAQKDENEVMEHDHNTRVGHDQTNTVGVDQTQEIGSNQTEHVGANQEMTVDGNRTTHTLGDFSETVDGSETRVVTSGVNETIDASETRTVTGGMTETITGDRSQTINGGSTETIGGSLTQTIVGGAKITTPASYEITAAGGSTIIAAGGIQLIVPAGHELVAPGGQTFIDQDQTNSGGTESRTFEKIIALCAEKLEIVPGLNLGFTGTQIEVAGIKRAVVATGMGNETIGDIVSAYGGTIKGAEMDITGTKPYV